MNLLQRERLEAVYEALCDLHKGLHGFLATLPKDAGDEEKRKAMFHALGRTMAALVLLKAAPETTSR